MIRMFTFYFTDVDRRRYTSPLIIFGFWMFAFTSIIRIWSCVLKMLLKQVKNLISLKQIVQKMTKFYRTFIIATLISLFF